MDAQKIHNLFEDYSSWLMKKAIVEGSGNTFHLITPFAYFDGDMIEVFVDVRSDGLLLSDDGLTIERLNQYGLDVYHKSRQEQIEKIIAGYSVISRHGELRKEVSPSDDLLLQLHRFTAAMLAVSYLVYTAKSNAASIFDNEVIYYLRENNVQSRHHSFIGSTMGKYKFDIVVEEKKIVLPIDCRKGGNSISKAERLGFRLTDMRRANIDFQAIAVLPNDTENIPRVGEIISVYADQVIYWEDRTNLLRQLSA